MQGEQREAEALFRKLDLNKDGKLTRDELIEGYRPLYGDMTEFEVDTILAAADLDGNGTIDYGEWRAATTKFNSKLSALQIKEAFDFFDRDGSGSISIDELRETLSGRINSDLAQFEKLVKEVDSNGNGEIDFQEFKRMMETFGGEVVNK
jgi:calcium-dependent protein kinase